MISIFYFLIFTAVAVPIAFLSYTFLGESGIGFILAIGLFLSTFENALLRARLRRYCRTAKEKGVSLDLN
jgi:hypothetical protein